jgi:hypothetical protein
MTPDSIDNSKWEFEELTATLLPMYEPGYIFLTPTLKSLAERSKFIVFDLLKGRPLEQVARLNALGKGTVEVRVRHLKDLMDENDSMVLIDNAQKKS